MTGENDRIDENDLHAWVDGQLPEDRRRIVESAVSADPDLAAAASAYRAQNEEIRALFGGVVNQPVPERLDVRRIAAKNKRRRWIVPLAASVVWLAIGLGLGWSARDRLPGAAIEDATRAVAARAVTAHQVYTVEVLHPVEVFAEQESHLVKWLSKRLDYEIRTPDLSGLGFHLVGGRLLPASRGDAAAQFMYEDLSGRRLTVYAGPNRAGGKTAFRYQKIEDIGAFIWLEDDMAFAITAAIPREQLLEAGEIVYDALDAD